MVQVKSESIKSEIAKLPKLLQEEWHSVCQYYSSKSDVQVFEEFKKRWDNFEGADVEEFLSFPKVVLVEWKTWKYSNGYDTDFKTRYNSIKNKKCECFMIDKSTKLCDHQVINKTLKEVLSEFKNFWEYDKPESKVMFKEMELLSKNMLDEWRLKYKFVYPHVYESHESNHSYNTGDYHLKSKAQLWDEFKEIWEIDTSNYNEDKYKEMSEYINEILCDDYNYSKDYPRNFFDFCENSNYHSFDSYSILEQFEICEEWERYREDCESEEDSDEESESEEDSDEEN
jgi:hypothetical protein